MVGVRSLVALSAGLCNLRMSYYITYVSVMPLKQTGNNVDISKPVKPKWFK